VGDFSTEEKWKAWATSTPTKSSSLEKSNSEKLGGLPSGTR